MAFAALYLDDLIHKLPTAAVQPCRDRGAPGFEPEPGLALLRRRNPEVTPVLFGNLQAEYLLVYRKQTTMLQDPFPLGYCILYRFERRVGGVVVCVS